MRKLNVLQQTAKSGRNRFSVAIGTEQGKQGYVSTEIWFSCRTRRQQQRMAKMFRSMSENKLSVDVYERTKKGITVIA
jgi:hypothetical protein